MPLVGRRCASVLLVLPIFALLRSSPYRGGVCCQRCASAQPATPIPRTHHGAKAVAAQLSPLIRPLLFLDWSSFLSADQYCLEQHNYLSYKTDVFDNVGGMALLRGYRSVANRILGSLQQPMLEDLLPELEPVDLTLRQVIYKVDAPVTNLYFVERGLVSLVKTMKDGRTVEIGAVGIEGVTGSNSLFGVNNALLESVVQIPGTALRINRDSLLSKMARNEVLRDMLIRYTHFSVSGIAQTAACNRLHSLEERCCRWLLIAHDSAQSDTFPLTHEFLALMLGTQRSGLSLIAKVLQMAGYIRYSRGQVTVKDRAGLEATSCECYRTLRVQADRVFRPPQPS
jgi:CRP-like cAMP-binding protein